MRTRSEPTPALLNREAERAALDNLLGDVRSGRGRALVVRGEAGAGKSALLDYAIRGAAGMRVALAVGVESEMELAFASVHQLCAPMLDHAERLPQPQRDALRVAFGLAEGRPPDRFLVAMAVLTLLSETAEDRPLLCVVDDAQWLDRASAQALAFAARRLLAEPVGLVFAAREPGEQLRGLTELEVRGLKEPDARALLGSVVRFRLDEQVRDRILAETNGNPLALLELPRGLSPTQLAGGFGLVGAQSVPARIEQGFRRRLAALPAQTRSLMLVAAAEPAGDPALVWRAARQLGIPASAAGAAQADGLLEIGKRVRFRHPLVRSAVYSSASLEERRAAHRALAEVTDAGHDPDRRAWHLAAATPGPDEQVAAELERSAGRAQARGGMAAAAAFLKRAAELTAEPVRRSARALAAGQVSLQAGGLDAAAELLALAMAGPLDELQQARAACCAGRSRSPLAAVATPRPCWQQRPGSSSRWMPGSHATPTWTRGLPRGSPGGSRAPGICTRSPRPPGRPPRLRACPSRRICCWTGWLCWSPRDAPRRHPYCGGQRGSLPKKKRSPSQKSCAGERRPATPRGSCGTRNAGTRSRSASFSPAARWACSPRW